MNLIQTQIDALAPWFHNLHLPDGTQTLAIHPLVYGDFPSNKWAVVADSIPADLRGWKVLDIGCNAGFYTFELARRGADVLGIDVNDHYLAQARWAAGQYGLEDRVEFRKMQVYDLAALAESFDLVWFMGVFYHLRYPMLGLDIVCQKARKLLVFQSLTLHGKEVAAAHDDIDLLKMEALTAPGWPKLAFIENKLAGDPTNWWSPNDAATQAMLRSAGMKVLKQLDQEIYVCAPDAEHPSSSTTWNQAEYRAATGLERTTSTGTP